MAIKDLIPTKWRKNNEIQVKNSNYAADPFWNLQRDMNRVFDTFFDTWGFPGAMANSFSPKLDIIESKNEYSVNIELPGIDEKDIDVSVTDDMLVISGMKKSETEDKKDNYYYMERSYGSFKRTIPLDNGVDKSKIAASFKKGILKVSIPKTNESISNQKKIPIHT